MVDNDVGEDDTRRHENSPFQIILPAEDIIQAFHVKTNNKVMSRDLYEIVTQIFVVILNNKIDNVNSFNELPHLDRMTDNRFFTDDVFEEQVKIATIEMACAMHERVKQFGIYYEGAFSYFFDGLIGYDLILSNFPY